MKLTVFFGCSMRGRHDNVSVEDLRAIQQLLKDMGLILASEHQTQQGIIESENKLDIGDIHDRDLEFIKRSSVCILELSDPSGGVGAELTDAVALGKPVLAIYRAPKENVSAYLLGKVERHAFGCHAEYTSLAGLRIIIENFLAECYFRWHIS